MTENLSPSQPLPTDDTRIGIIGLGYVGLPLAVAFGASISRRAASTPTAGASPSCSAATMRHGRCRTMSWQRPAVSDFTSVADNLLNCNVLIVAVPTPIDDAKQPDLTALK